MRDGRTRATAAPRHTARYVSALMNETSRILLIDDSAADIELAARLLRDTYANATLVAVTETATLADALSGARPDAVVLAPMLGWASSEKVQALLRERWPAAAVVLFGHERDVVGACLNPGRACAGIVRKSSGGFMALPDVLGAALERAAAPASAAPLALDALPLPAVRSDASGVIRATSASFATRLGSATEKLINTPLAAHCLDADTRDVLQNFLSGDDAECAVSLANSANAPAGTLALRRGADGGLLGCLLAPPAADPAKASTGHEGETASREVHDMALVFSHDLRQPMQQIMRLTRQLGEADGKPSPRGDARALDQLHTCAERASNMLDSMLEYLAVSARDERPGLVDLNQCLDEALDNLRASIDENEAQVYAERLPSIVGDAYQMVHLFQNLVGNALKFRGRARPEVRIVARDEHGRWRIEVQDNGIGVPPAHRERVFEMGQRLHTHDEYPGTGMGLALCRRIVERHGGTIRLEGGAESGSVVVIDLPLPPGQMTRLA